MGVEDLRVGQGYDIHQLVEGRELWLGGVLIPSPSGLLGHSDADALLHSICDALLGAADLGDIGRQFPPSDNQYKDIPSIELLRRVYQLIRRDRFSIINLDTTVILERPKIVPYIPDMKKAISAALAISEGRVSIKATTKEGLDDVGRKLGAEAFTTVLMIKSGD